MIGHRRADGSVVRYQHDAFGRRYAVTDIYDDDLPRLIGRRRELIWF